MIKRNDAVLVGLSGGADSVALFHFLCANAELFGITVSAAHLEHGLRGDESLRDRRFVEELCDRMGVELRVKSVDVATLAKQRGVSVEVCARDERYAFFGELAGRDTLGAPGASRPTATAHTATDNAETILLNLTRGTSLAGLCGVPPVRGNIIRPLIECTREMVEAYCAGNNLEYVTDSTNDSDEYTRNRIRRHVMPQLRGINPNLESRLTEMSGLLREDSDYLEHIADSALSYERERYLALERPVASRVLILMLKRLGLHYDKERIDNMDACIREGGAYQLSSEYRLVADAEHFRLEKKPEAFPSFLLTIPKAELERAEGFTVFEGKRLIFRRIDCKDLENSEKNLFKNCLDYDRIDEVCFLRGRLPGDAIKLWGRGCTKTLKDLCREAGMGASSRERMVILESDGKAAWAEGFGTDESFSPRKGSTNILNIEISGD
jgi:tRNA(Ile)-lysidine synthase